MLELPPVAEPPPSPELSGRLAPFGRGRGRGPGRGGGRGGVRKPRKKVRRKAHRRPAGAKAGEALVAEEAKEEEEEEEAEEPLVDDAGGRDGGAGSAGDDRGDPVTIRPRSGHKHSWTLIVQTVGNDKVQVCCITDKKCEGSSRTPLQVAEEIAKLVSPELAGIYGPVVGATYLDEIRTLCLTARDRILVEHAKPATGEAG